MTASGAAGAHVTAAYFEPKEIELVGRLILGDLPVALLPGAWWSYLPSQEVIFYPQHLLTEWTSWQMTGAMCHEAAEARFTGKDGSSDVARWLRRASKLGLSAPSAQLLVNTVNDMRVNRLYMERYPGSEAFLRALYEEDPGMHAKDDLRIPPELDLGRYRPLHHDYVDAVSLFWIESVWPGSAKGPKLPSEVSAALRKTWRDIEKAAACDAISQMLAILEKKVVPAYADLVSQWKPEELIDAASNSDDRESSEDDSQLPKEETPSGGEPLPGESASGQAVSLGGAGSSLRQIKSLPKVTAASVRMRSMPASGAGVVKRGAPTEAERRSIDPLSAAVVQQLRRKADERIDYTKFDYIEAVSRLEPKIAETIDGDGRRPGLAEIMDRRRHGSSEAHRRPRKQRLGDQGEINLDNPERLVVEPSIAFLKGVRVPREDRQRDFASSILLDVSGSMVQKGYPTRKFDRLVETAILFMEIHERLRIPYEVTAFSSDITSLLPFSKSGVTAMPASLRDYKPKDHSNVFRSLYELDHKDTDDSTALRSAIENGSKEKGLKSIFMITDGISSDPAELRRALIDLDRRNRNSSERQRMKVLAFGIGVVKSEFDEAYQATRNGKPLNSCSGVVVDELNLLPGHVGAAVDERIRYA